jgi:hypothetical protein
MKRVRVWLFSGAAAVSVALCLATAVLWVRSYWESDTVEKISYTDDATSLTDHVMFFNSEDGRYSLTWYDRIWLKSISNPHVHLSYPNGFFYRQGIRNISRQGPMHESVDHSWIVRFAGCGYMRQLRDQDPNDMPASRGFFIYVPHAYILIGTAILPVIWVLKRQRIAKDSGHGSCSVCVYDLRATPDRCPECGTVPSKKKIVSA